MKIEEKGHTIIIKDTKGDIKSFGNKLTEVYNSYKSKNIVLDLTVNKNVALEAILSFMTLSNKHRKAKKSFVIVVNDFDFNESPEEMLIVPTVLEATDIIEMEEIERDLGF